MKAPDCGDNNCVCADNKSGQRTNGGCRCTPIDLKKKIWIMDKKYSEAVELLEKIKADAIVSMKDCIIRQQGDELAQKIFSILHNIHRTYYDQANDFFKRHKGEV